VLEHFAKYLGYVLDTAAPGVVGGELMLVSRQAPNRLLDAATVSEVESRDSAHL
jgi:hypothetical protein